MELSYPFPEFLDIVLQEGLTLGGIVNDSHGMPLIGAKLSVSLSEESDALRSVSFEGSSGAFELKGLPAGTLELCVSLPDGRELKAPIELESDRKILVLVGSELRLFPY